jgi:manganese/zinc/iron transport system substrate-binding protein
MKICESISVALVAAVLVSPLAAERGRAQEPLAVVSTIGMIADVAAEVGGECVAVETLIGPGLDPHLYQASASDVALLQGADAILYAGFGLEGQLAAVLGRFGEMRPTLAVSPASVPEDRLITIEGYAGVDPHLWMDPNLWALTAPAIAEFLGELAPGCAEDMAKRAEAYRAEVEALAEWVGRAVGSVPEEDRTLVTAHDAFGYFARAYGLEQIGIQGISTESEASVADIRATADAVVAAGVPAIFVETTINPRTVEAVIEAARERGHEVAQGGSLYSDAMGEPGTPGGTYIGMIYENARTIAEALGGTAPPLPAALGTWAQSWDLAAE